MNNAKGWAVLAVIFLSGLVLGLSSATVWFTQGPRHAPRPAGPPRLETAVDHLARVVGLDEEQKATALAAFRKHEPEVRDTLRNQREAMDAVLDATLADLRPSLTREQNARLDAFVARIKQGPGPGGPGGPGMGPDMGPGGPGGPGMGPGGPGDLPPPPGEPGMNGTPPPPGQ